LLRRNTRAVFGIYSDEANVIRQTLLLLWVTYCRRVLGERRPDLTAFQLERLLLVGLDLSGCCFRLANLAGTRFIRCDLAAADLGESLCRDTESDKCEAAGASFLGPARPEGRSGGPTGTMMKGNTSNARESSLWSRLFRARRWLDL